MNVKNIRCNIQRECWTKYKRIDELFKNHLRLVGPDFVEYGNKQKLQVQTSIKLDKS